MLHCVECLQYTKNIQSLYKIRAQSYLFISHVHFLQDTTKVKLLDRKLPERTYYY